MPEIISYQEAVVQGLKRYFTGKPCKRGHFCARHVASRRCIECNVACDKRRRAENPEENRASQRRYRKKYPERNYISQEKYRKANAEKVRNRQRAWRHKNPEKCREYNARTRKKHANILKASARERARKYAAAYRALKELGIQI